MRKFEEIAAEHFKIPLDQVVDSLTAKTIPDWDSLHYLLFIAELEKEFNISFTMDEVLSTESLGSVRKYLRSKGAPV